MESWEVVGGREKTTKATGQGLRPKPSVGLLGGPNREQGGRSGGEPPKNGATRHNERPHTPPPVPQHTTHPPSSTHQHQLHQALATTNYGPHSLPSPAPTTPRTTPSSVANQQPSPPTTTLTTEAHPPLDSQYHRELTATHPLHAPHYPTSYQLQPRPPIPLPPRAPHTHTTRYHYPSHHSAYPHHPPRSQVRHRPAHHHRSLLCSAG